MVLEAVTMVMFFWTPQGAEPIQAENKSKNNYLALHEDMALSKSLQRYGLTSNRYIYIQNGNMRQTIML